MNFLNFLAVNAADLGKSLEIMWKGVLAIFIVIALVILVTNGVNKFFVKREEEKARKEQSGDDAQNLTE